MSNNYSPIEVVQIELISSNQRNLLRRFQRFEFQIEFQTLEVT